MLQMSKTNYNYYYVAKKEGNQLWVNDLKVSKEDLKRASKAGLEGIKTSKVRVTNRRQLEEYVNYWLEIKGRDWISDKKTTMAYTVVQGRKAIALEKQNYLDLMCLSSAGHPDDPKMREHKLELPRGLQLGAIDPKIAHKYCAHGLERNANPSVTYALSRIYYKEKNYKGSRDKPGALDLANRLRDQDFSLSYLLLADAFSNGKGVKKNLQMVRSLLDEGPPEDPNILYAKGLYNYLGILKPLDNKKNRQYFKAAADQGHGTAMVWFGKMLEAGHGGPKDINSALALYRKSNALGNLDGKMALGKAYYFGRGVKQSYERSLGYIRPAGSMKHPEANFYLGYMYANGLGVKANRNSSLKYYEKAIKAGHTNARGGYAVAYYDDMQKAKEGKSYHRWLVDAANRGQKAAKYVLARKHLIGFDVPRSLPKALSMLEENIAGNHTPSMNYMGGLYEQGRYVRRDYNEAFRYYKMSADRGSSEAIYKVGIFYHAGRQGEANRKYARQWYEKAAQAGHSNAQVRTAILYHFPNDGSAPDLKLARKWYDK
ncbi:MAG: sel1 repeat family protein, partial [Sneathiellales bacterium]|nr:sel1 repeat family protein [Sneathiellales bacterium]